MKLLHQSLAALGALLITSLAHAATVYAQNFDNVGPTPSPSGGPAHLSSEGWIFRNQSQPLGSMSWMQGSTGFGSPPPQSGAGYMTVNGASADGLSGGAVSNWAILPAFGAAQTGESLTLWVHSVPGSYPHALEVRYSPTGGTSTGTGAAAVGHFTTVLIQLNPIPASGWTQHTVAIPGAGRLALRYVATDVCSLGCFTSVLGIDSLSIGDVPLPACNLPPVPQAAGQTVVWTAADSPYRVCENIGIPPGSTVVVEAGASIVVDTERTISVGGTLRLEGEAGDPVSFDGALHFMPPLVVTGGTLEATYTDFTGLIEGRAGTLALTNCRFEGANTQLRTASIPQVQPFVTLDRCEFAGAGALLVDALVVMRDCSFVGAGPSILRGYTVFEGANSVDGASLSIIREAFAQPWVIEGVTVRNVVGAPALDLAGGEYFLGEDNFFENVGVPLRLLGGLAEGSTLPDTGFSAAFIDVGDAGFAGWGTWPALGLPYRMTGSSTSLPGGDLTIAPGAVVEGTTGGTGLVMRSTRHVVIEGLPGAPIVFRDADGGAPWQGLVFATNSTEGSRVEHAEISGARFGVIASDSGAYVSNTLLHGNDVGLNANSFGSVHAEKSRLMDNSVGASVSGLGYLDFDVSPSRNAIAGNSAGIDAFNFDSDADARRVWWGSPTGPQSPLNPSGTGDSIIGPGATGVMALPFLTSSPNFSDHPPTVRLVEPSPVGSSLARGLNFLAEPGSKFVFHWSASDDGSIASQKILFSPDGHYLDRFVVIAENLPPGQRSFEWSVADPGFAATNQPQFIRVVAVDNTGQEGWDQFGLIVPTAGIEGQITITTDLTGQTFHPGDPIPDIHWTGSLTNFPMIEEGIWVDSDGVELPRGPLDGLFPYMSTDSLRLYVRARNNSNQQRWFAVPGSFSLRHDPRLGLAPPTVEVTAPAGGASVQAGRTTLVTWTADAPEGLHFFDVQGSYDGGKTWHLIARALPASARSFQWMIAPSDTGNSDVRVRVIAHDRRFQNSSDTTQLSVTPGQFVAPCPGDVDGDGEVGFNDLNLLLGEYGQSGAGLGGDLDGDGDVDFADLNTILGAYGAGC